MYICSNFQVANRHIWQDMNYFLVVNFGQVTSDRQKAMHKSPPCIRTGVLKKSRKLVPNVSRFSPYELYQSCIDDIHFSTILYSLWFRMIFVYLKDLFVTDFLCCYAKSLSL